VPALQGKALSSNPSSIKKKKKERKKERKNSYKDSTGSSLERTLSLFLALSWYNDWNQKIKIDSMLFTNL
jgi:hypothetical protein